MNVYTELNAFPRQKISHRKKQSKDWQESCVDAVISECNTYGRTGRSDTRIKLRNYNLFNGKIDKADFEYVLNPFNLSKDLLNAYQFPASLQPYDVVSPILMLLFGEEAKRPFDPIVMASNADAINQKLEERKGMLLEILQEMLMPPQEEGQEPPPTPERFLQIAQTNAKDMRERAAQHLLNYYLKRLDTSNIFQLGWKDALVAGEEIYSIDEVASSVKLRRVNPLDIHFVLAPNSDMMDDAEKIYERNRMSVSQIIDEFYEYLTPDQIDDLENYGSGASTIYNYSFGGPSVDTYFGQAGFPTVNTIYDFDESSMQYGIDVHRVRWKSKRKLGTYHYIDPQTQEEQEILIDEFFNVKVDGVNEWIEWFWVNEYWEGVRIGQDMYLNVRQRKNQFRSVDNLSECKSGYVGTIYNSNNAQSVSLVDRIYPWFCLYTIVLYRTELLLAANMNKLAMIDTSLIPEGWEMEKWLYYAQSMKIGFVNSYNEGQKGEKIGRVNQSQQVKSLDLETGNSIQYNIQLLGYIEKKMKDTAGVTDQRLGAISASELVGNTERAVVQSSHITEEWFRVHNHTKLRVCEAIIAVAKALKNSKVLQYITDDLGPIMFNIDQDAVSDADYGVFIGNGAKEHEALAALKELLGMAIQSDKMSMSEVVDVINSNSISTLKSKLKMSEQQRMEQANQMQQQQQELDAQRMAMEQERFERQMAMEQYKVDSTNETKIAVAELGAFKYQQDLDADNDGVIDPTEVANLRLKELELKSKENIEKLKIEQTEVQNRNQEKMQREQIKLKEKELEAKERIEKVKARSKKTPKK